MTPPIRRRFVCGPLENLKEWAAREGQKSAMRLYKGPDGLVRGSIELDDDEEHEQDGEK